MHLSFTDIVLLVVAGILAGVMNAVAGGGTFLTFPALVFTGIPNIAANQTEYATPAFDRLVPWLLFFATSLFAFGNKIRKRFGWHFVHPSHGKIGWTALLKAGCLQLVIGLYGGFYGAGAGILELAVLDMLVRRL